MQRQNRHSNNRCHFRVYRVYPESVHAKALPEAVRRIRLEELKF